MGKPEIPDMGFALTLKPEAVIRYFQSLGYDTPENWQQIAQQTHAHARTIAGIYKQDITAEFYRSLQTSLTHGTSYRAWQQDIMQRLQRAGYQGDKTGDIIDTATGEVQGTGLTRHRLELIYRNNMTNAYAAGQWQVLQANKANRPYLRYNAIMDNRVRPAHATLHGLIYHIDDAFWQYFYPPNGHRCRCSVMALSEHDMERQGLTAQSAQGQLEIIEITNRAGQTHTVQTIKMPDGKRFAPDKGFDHNVGINHLAQLGQLQMQRAIDLPPHLASMAVGEALKQPEFIQSLIQQSTQLVQTVLTEKQARGKMLYVGVLPMQVLNGLEQKHITPQSAVIAMSDERVLHALRDNKVKPLPVTFWERLPEALQEPEAVLLDTQQNKNALIFVYPNDEGKGKLILTLDYEMKSRHPSTGKRERVVVNMVNTGSIMDEAQRTALKGYETIWKK